MAARTHDELWKDVVEDSDCSRGTAILSCAKSWIGATFHFQFMESVFPMPHIQLRCLKSDDRYDILEVFGGFDFEGKPRLANALSDED